MRKFKKALAFALASAMIVSAAPVSAATTNSAKGTKSTIYTYTVDKSKKGDANNKRSWIKVTTKKGYTYKLVNKTKDIVSLTKTRVEAKKTGTAKINVNFYKNGKYVETKSVKITVKKAPMIGKVTLDKNEITVGETTKVSNAGKGTAYFYSSNKDVATVDKTTGEITAKAAGTTTISAVNTITKARVYLTLTVNAQLAAKQSGASEITVTGADLANKDITVTRGSSNVTFTKQVSEDGKTAVLTTASKIVASEYTVKVGDKTVTFTGEAGRVETITVVGENLAMDGNIGNSTKGTVAYKVLNQFGEDITNTTTVTASTSAKSATASKGIVTVEFATAPNLNDAVSVVLLYQSTGKSGAATLKVSNKAVPYTITEKGVYNENNKALTATNLDSEEFYYLFQVKDQYGNEMTDPDAVKSSFYVSSATGLTNIESVTASAITTKTVNGTKYLALPIEVKAGESALPGDITLILTPGGSGQTLTTKLTVEAGAIVNTISVTAPSVVPAGNDAVEFSYSALDKDGNEVTSLTQLKKVLPENSKFTFVKEGNTVKLYFNSTTLSSGASYSEVFTTPTYNSTVVVVNVSAASYPSEITGLKTTSNTEFATAQLAGRTINLTAGNFKVVDQYGNSVSLDTSKYAIKVVGTDGSAFTANETKVIGADDTYTLTAGENSGTTTVTFAICDKDGNDIKDSNGNNITTSNTFDVTFRAVKESQIKSYTVADVAQIYGGKSSKGTPSGYELKDVDVYGVVSSSVKVKLEKGTDYAILPSTNLVVSGSGIVYSGTTYSSDLDAKFQVVINSTGDVVEKDTKVSFTKPAVSKYWYQNDVTYLTVTASEAQSGLSAALLSQIGAIDTYGKDLTFTGNTAKYADGTEATVQVVVSDMSFYNNSAKVTGNGTSSVAIANATANDSFKVAITIGGKTLTSTVNVR